MIFVSDKFELKANQVAIVSSPSTYAVTNISDEPLHLLHAIENLNYTMVTSLLPMETKEISIGKYFTIDRGRVYALFREFSTSVPSEVEIPIDDFYSTLPVIDPFYPTIPTPIPIPVPTKKEILFDSTIIFVHNDNHQTAFDVDYAGIYEYEADYLKNNHTLSIPEYPNEYPLNKGKIVMDFYAPTHDYPTTIIIKNLQGEVVYTKPITLRAVPRVQK